MTTRDSEQLSAFARDYAAAWCSLDPAQVAAHYAPNGSLTINGGAPAVGRAAIAESARAFFTAHPDLQVFFDDLVVQGDRIEFHWTFTGTNTGPGGNGKPVRVSGFEEWTLSPDGLISASLGHYEAADYARQLEHGYPFLDEAMALLERTPRVLHDLLDGLPDAWLTGRDTPEGWQPRDVVGHLISAELDDWIPRAQRILEHGTDRAFDRFDRFAHEERDVDTPMAVLLERFAQLRAASLARIRELVGEDELDRVGLHPSLGQVTMRQLLATWAVHDLDHTSQVFAAMSASQDAAVGPWKAYLGILLRRTDPSAVPG